MVKFPTHQRPFKNVPTRQTVYSDVNILLNTTEISKVLESCLSEVFSFPKAHIWRAFSKALKSSNKTVNIGAMTHGHDAHAECGKNCEIFLLATLTTVLTRKSNAQLGGAHFGSNSPMNGAKLQSNARGMPSEDGRIWNWLVHNYVSVNLLQNILHLLFP